MVVRGTFTVSVPEIPYFWEAKIEGNRPTRKQCLRGGGEILEKSGNLRFHLKATYSAVFFRSDYLSLLPLIHDNLFL